jgi:hypothetical protein
MIDRSSAYPRDLERLAGIVDGDDQARAELSRLLAVVHLLRCERRDVHLVGVWIAPEYEARVELGRIFEWLEHNDSLFTSPFIG